MTLITWMICLFILCVIINIGSVGEKKLIYYLFVIIGPPIYVQIIEMVKDSAGSKRLLLIIAMIILFLIPPVLTFRGFMMDAPRDKEWSRRNSITDHDRQLFEWLEENTTVDAVIVENNIYHLSPVFAGRRNLYSWYYVVTGLGYGGEKFDLYKDIQSGLYGENPLVPEIIEKMKNVEQKLYIAVWQEDVEKNQLLEGRFDSHPEWFKEVYSSKQVSVYTLNEDSP